jgi:hypothetical protein
VAALWLHGNFQRKPVLRASASVGALVMLPLAEGFEIGEIVMVPITDGPMSDNLEGSKDDARSVLALGILAACLIVLLLTIGFGIFGSETVAPNTPQPTTESPGPSNSTNP